jgi:hypothetical protein
MKSRSAGTTSMLFSTGMGTIVPDLPHSARGTLVSSHFFQSQFAVKEWCQLLPFGVPAGQSPGEPPPGHALAGKDSNLE